MLLNEQAAVIAQTQDKKRAYLAAVDETNEAILRNAAERTKIAVPAFDAPISLSYAAVGQ